MAVGSLVMECPVGGVSLAVESLAVECPVNGVSLAVVNLGCGEPLLDSWFPPGATGGVGGHQYEE